MMEKKLNENCPCCTEFLGYGIFTPYRKGKCLAQSNNFLILPAVGSLIYPYLILEPKFHINSFSKLSQGLLLEANELLADFLEPYENKFHIIVAEHGENFKSLEHAHIHIIMFNHNDTASEYWDELIKYNQLVHRNKSLSNFFELLFKLNSEAEYTLVWSCTRKSIIGFNSDEIPTNARNQFIRRVLGEIINKPWNWLAYEGIENIERTFHEFNFEEIKK